MRLIPAIDIIDGKCVRLTQGDYNQKKIYNEDPLEVAKEFEDAGIQYLHLVDLDGAKSGHVVNHTILGSITHKTNLKVDFGGGVKTSEDIQKVFDCGAEQVTCGSIAVKNREMVLEWVEKYGARRLILGADVRDKQVAISGWTEKTGVSIFDLVHRYVTGGLSYVICTDIATDGMLTGPNFALYTELLETFPTINLIASGGVSSIDDVRKLKKLKVEGVIIGKAIYEGKVTLEQLSTLSYA